MKRILIISSCDNTGCTCTEVYRTDNKIDNKIIEACKNDYCDRYPDYSAYLSRGTDLTLSIDEINNMQFNYIKNADECL